MNEIADIMTKADLDETEKAEFTEYIANRFENCEEQTDPDTGFLKAWEGIISYAAIFGAEAAINTKICPQRPVKFNSPGEAEITLYSSFAGTIPVICVRDTADFEQLVTNVAYKGIRPDGLEKTGASFISGKTTRFMILSAKPYSNVPASELGLDDDAEWAGRSVQLRRAHECTHFFTKQTYGISNNILHDETIADFIGIYEAFGFYRAEWFLRFMGVISGSGSRLEFYTKDLSPKVRAAVSGLLKEAAYRLEEWSETDDFKAMSVGERIKLLCRKGLSEMINPF